MTDSSQASRFYSYKDTTKAKSPKPAWADHHVPSNAVLTLNGQPAQQKSSGQTAVVIKQILG